MVMLKRQPVEMVPPPNPSEFKGDDPDVFYMAATGEIFLDYESYAQRLTFYNQPIFQDELTGKVNLTFFQAVQSEREETVKLHRRFPEALKQPVLRAVQFVITGRLDNLIDLVFERFKDRYFIGEAIFVDLQGDKYYARVKDVFAPRSLVKWHTQQAEKQASTSTADIKPPTPAEVVHQIGCDLDRNVEDSVKIDDPEDYIYSIQLVDESGQFTGSLMEVRNKQLSRDRLTFSKAILKKYLRECVVRDSAVGSPWVVRHTLAHRYGIPIAPDQATIEKNNVIKEMKLSKRKRNQEEETPATPDVSISEPPAAATAAKKQKKTKAEKEAEKAEHSTSAIKTEVVEEEKIKKKPIKFPIEDLEVDPVSERELKAKIAGEPPRRRDRPVPKKDLGIPHDVFEPLLITYHFLQAFGRPLMLAPFTLDDYQSALQHDTAEPSCTLIAEIHACLINLIVRDGTHSKGLAPAALADKAGARGVSSNGRAGSDGAEEEEEEEEEEVEAEEEEESGDELDSREATPTAGNDAEAGEDGEEKDEAEDAEDAVEREASHEVLSAAVNLGRGWENRVLKLDDDRRQWEQSLVGILAKRATAESMPRQMAILSHMTGKEHPDGLIDGAFIGATYSTPKERYPAIAFADKVAAIHFLCDLAVMTRAIKSFFDECEVALTELRKERVELSRQRKRIIEERAAAEKKEEEANGEGEGEGEESKAEGDADETGEVAEENGNGNGAASEEPESSARRKKAQGRPKGSKAKKMPTPQPDEEDAGDGDESEQDELESSPEPDADSNASAAAEEEDEEDASPSKSGARTLGSRQAAILEKKRQRKEAEAERQRELARQRQEQKAKTLENKRAQAERLRWEEEEDRITRREEAIDLEFRRHHLAPRLRPLGKDRFHDRYWWFDGVGNQNLVGLDDQVLYGAGRLFVQGASREDWAAACVDRSHKAMLKRRQEEHGECILEHDEWAVYDDPEQVEQLIAWLRNKGNRENAFKRQLATFRGYLGPGMQKRLEDLDPERSAAAQAQALAEAEAAMPHETRRSARKHEAQPTVLAPHNRYLAWTNSQATK
ncbi:hypothetical protein BDZ90DRAFT_279725 [Jaminaea rosea]|uniref:WAC domain-containing protein n=1 Tax=Jaminaea rosea TaxID=1569628 RepID=A0A316UPZ4_9BASI|nr:hypothetical protein BDZ90DRAFT_279725 [Jaminaea rosea]PWN27366.1 hypothetical protein BDZ90DRAFT_279725 [Jaminaea rosea]